MVGALPSSKVREQLVGLVGSVVGDQRVIDQLDVDASVPLAQSMAVRLAAPVLFQTDRAAVRREHTANIRRCASILAKVPGSTVIITGHTDSRGSDAYNDVLGLARAQAVQQVLVAQGVKPSRVQAVSAGRRQPVEDNATLAGRRRNRRVELVFADLLGP